LGIFQGFGKEKQGIREISVIKDISLISFKNRLIFKLGDLKIA
jgi:hypothetical protein